MSATNLIPTSFSSKGLKSLIKQIKKTNDFLSLKESGLFYKNELNEKSVNAYFEKATRDDKSTVYFNQKNQQFEISAGFEVGCWSNNLQTVSFDFSDFNYNVVD